jgi:hypothetical protein
MSQPFPAVIVAVSDARFGGKWTSIDAEVLRLLVLGSKNVKTINVSTTIKAGSTLSDKVNAYTSDANYLVIKSIVVSIDGTLHLFIDDVDNPISVRANTLVDLESIFGAKAYGSKVDIQVEVATAPTSDTSVTVTLYGFETAGKVQTPTA